MDEKEHKTKVPGIIAKSIKGERVVVETNLNDTSKQALAERLGEELLLLLDDLGERRNPLTSGGKVT